MAKTDLDAHRVGLKLLILLAAVGGLTSAQAAPAPGKEPTQLTMMDDMGKRGEMGNMSGMSGPGAATGTGTMNDQSGGGMGGMCCMGAMGKAPGAGTTMTMTSALPGFPGASHLYHVGASGFFLDYSDKLGFSVEQKASLNGTKQRALVEQSAAQRKIDEAEQALWMITAAEQPDAAAIEAKLREIEKLRSDMRLSFIRAVGEAAKVLTVEQRKMVLGLAPMPGPSAGMPAK